MYSEDSQDDISVDHLYRRKYYLLLEQCELIQTENERIVQRIQHVNKLILKYKKQRSIIIRRLDEHGDPWREAPYVLDLRNIQTDCDSISDKIIKNPKKKNEKTIRDPNAPKRPANPFFQFCQQQRSILLDDKNKDLSKQEITKELAKKWSSLSPEDKKFYYEKYEQSRLKYKADIEEYKAKSQTSSTSNASTVSSSTPLITPVPSPSSSTSSVADR